MLFIIAAVFAGLVVADLPVGFYTFTECKRCPYALCSNEKFYDYPNNSTSVNCWTKGSDIYNDTTWLRTVDNCYVAQYDVEESPDTDELPYCGRVDEPEWPKNNGRTRYFSECWPAPYIYRYGTVTKYYKNSINLNLLCVARNVTHEILNKTTWYKTNSNCFVHETTLWRVDEDEIEDCGPLDYEWQGRWPPDEEPAQPDSLKQTSDLWIAADDSATESDLESQSSENHNALHRRWLYNTDIGEEYVNCTTSSNFTDRATGVKRVYEFNETIYPQCATWSPDTHDIMLFTTDFCYIKDDETWVRLVDNLLRSEVYPHCESFVDEVS